MYNTNHDNQKIRKRDIHNSINCFFCGRKVSTYKCDIITPNELYENWGLINNTNVYLCATCQYLYEEEQEEKELEQERQNDGYDYYWESNNP